eukprot:TRINITY_DN6713_c0_g2_i1.p1 TRINITY_DN6713_c0_g2~~TRINITY_DN6713_c0_g2_i1.p1  ORF type:complete len:764 (+),score=261.09 TRINITY_DN6713_c0_g2_i1:76-2367(+)
MEERSRNFLHHSTPNFPVSQDLTHSYASNPTLSRVISNNRSGLSSSWTKILGSSASNPVKSSYEPLTFSRSAFHIDNFNVDSFITETRRRVPLESVVHDLDEYSKGLSLELIELINRDYLDFVDLSSNLVGLEFAIENLRKPLLLMVEDISKVKVSLDERISTFESKMKEKRNVQSKKSVLILCLEVARSIAQIERLMRGKEGGENREEGEKEEAFGLALSGDDEQSSSLIERVATEFNQLKYYVSKGKDLPFVKKQEAHIQSIENTLERGLARLFNESLSTKNERVMSNCLRTYAAVDKTKVAEEIFKKAIVRPFAQNHITLKNLDEANGLDGIFSILIDFIQKDCQLVFQVAKPIRGFHFLVNCVFEEFSITIINRLSKIFTPAFPDSFLKNYNTSIKFLENIESFCESKSELELLRFSLAYGEFMKKWNTSVYFQLRMQDIASRLESSFTEQIQIKNPSNSTQNSPEELVLNPSVVLWESLNKCWNSDIFLRAAGHRFLRLNLQLIVRYKNWIEEEINKDSSANPKKSTSFWSFVVHDIQILSNLILKGSLLKRIEESLENPPEEVLNTISGCFEEQLKGSMGLEEKLKELVTHPTLQKSLENLRALRGIPVIYRMNKGTPTTPSAYVGATLAPIREFFTDSAFGWSKERRKEWISFIFKQLLEQYAVTMQEMLSGVENSENAIKKMLKKNNKTSTTPTTDIGKIWIQLQLDVEAFGNHLNQLEVNPENFEPHKKVLNTIKTGRKKFEESKLDADSSGAE